MSNDNIKIFNTLPKWRSVIAAAKIKNIVLSASGKYATLVLGLPDNPLIMVDQSFLSTNKVKTESYYYITSGGEEGIIDCAIMEADYEVIEDIVSERLTNDEIREIEADPNNYYSDIVPTHIALDFNPSANGGHLQSFSEEEKCSDTNFTSSNSRDEKLFQLLNRMSEINYNEQVGNIINEAKELFERKNIFQNIEDSLNK